MALFGGFRKKMDGPLSAGLKGGSVNDVPSKKNDNIPEEFLTHYKKIHTIFSLLPSSIASKLLENKDFIHILIGTTPLTYISGFILSGIEKINKILNPYNIILYNGTQGIYVFNTTYCSDAKNRESIVKIGIIPGYNILSEEINRIKEDHQDNPLLCNTQYSQQFDTRISTYPAYTRLKENITIKERLITESIGVETVGLQELKYNGVDLQITEQDQLFTTLVCNGQRFFTTIQNNSIRAKLDPSFNDIRKLQFFAKTDTGLPLFTSFLQLYRFAIPEHTYAYLESLQPKDIVVMKLHKVFTYTSPAASRVQEGQVQLITRNGTFHIPLPLAIAINVAFNIKIFISDSVEKNMVNQDIFEAKKITFSQETLLSHEQQLIYAIDNEHFEQAAVIRNKIVSFIDTLSHDELQRIIQEITNKNSLLLKVIKNSLP